MLPHRRHPIAGPLFCTESFTSISMAEENLNWISLQEAQILMGRCESTARRIIRKHSIRTKKVLVDRGQELRICLQDVQQLLPDESVALQKAPPSSPAKVVDQAEFVDEFQNSMRALVQASTAQMEVLERLSVRLDSNNHERTEVVESQRQLSDSLANINRASKAQATALLEFGDRLKEQSERSSAPLAAAATICLCLGLLIGAGAVYFLIANKPSDLDAQVKKALDAERATWGKELDEKLRQQRADLESRAKPASLAESNNAGDEKETDEIRIIEVKDDEPMTDGEAPDPEQPADETPEVSKVEGLIVPTPGKGQ